MNTNNIDWTCGYTYGAFEFAALFKAEQEQPGHEQTPNNINLISELVNKYREKTGDTGGIESSSCYTLDGGVQDTISLYFADRSVFTISPDGWEAVTPLAEG